MSKDLEVLISDKTINIDNKAIIISKPKWSDINQFIAIVEGYINSYIEISNDLEFTKFLMKEGKAIKDIESVIAMCLRKNNLDNVPDFLANLDYDRVFNILIIVIKMNVDFFKQGMEKIGLRAEVVEEEETPALTGES